MAAPQEVTIPEAPAQEQLSIESLTIQSKLNMTRKSRTVPEIPTEIIFED